MELCQVNYSPRTLSSPPFEGEEKGEGDKFGTAKRSIIYVKLNKVVNLYKFCGSFVLLLALVFWVYYSRIVFMLRDEMGWIWRSKSLRGG